MLYFMASFALLDLQLMQGAAGQSPQQPAGTLASVALLRTRLAGFLLRRVQQNAGGAEAPSQGGPAALTAAWCWETRADCLMAVFPLIVGSDKPVADAMADLVRAQTKQSGQNTRSPL